MDFCLEKTLSPKMGGEKTKTAKNDKKTRQATVKDNTRTIWGKQKQPKTLFHGMCSDSYAKSDLKQKTMECSSLPAATKCLSY